MKVTTADYDLADRFPFMAKTDWGYGTSPGDARVSPAQLQRLLKLELIRMSPSSSNTGGYAGKDGKQNPGAGFGRIATTFVRTYNTRPK